VYPEKTTYGRPYLLAYFSTFVSYQREAYLAVLELLNVLDPSLMIQLCMSATGHVGKDNT
jgi:hypothetical protein